MSLFSFIRRLFVVERTSVPDHLTGTSFVTDFYSHFDQLTAVLACAFATSNDSLGGLFFCGIG